MALKFTLAGASHDLDIAARKPELTLEIDGRFYRVADHGSGEGRRTIEIDGKVLEFVEARDGNVVHLKLGGQTWAIGLVDPRDAARSQSGGSDEIRAPMPGAVVSVVRREGETVKRGATVMTIESMKLQTALTAPRDGVIACILKQENETFDKDEVVVMMAAEQPASERAAE